MQDQITPHMENIESDEETYSTQTISESSPTTISTSPPLKRKTLDKNDSPTKPKRSSERWDKILSSFGETQTQLAKMLERQSKSSNEEFCQYISTTLDNISDSAIVSRVKLHIKLILSKAALEAAQLELLSEDALKIDASALSPSSSKFCEDPGGQQEASDAALLVHSRDSKESHVKKKTFKKKREKRMRK